MDNDEKIRHFEQQIVIFHGYRQAYAKIEMAIESTRLRGIPTSAVLTGPSGAGKSTLSKIFRDSFPAPYEKVTPAGIHRIVPAFYCSVPPKVTIKSFCKVALEGLECSDTHGDTVDLELRIIELIKTCETKIIIIDEFQTLADPENDKQLKGLIGWLLGIINRITIPIIAVGTKECKSIIYKESRLARRFPFLAELNYFEFSQDQDSDYTTLIQRLDSKLYEIGNLKPGIHLTDPNICAPLFVATQGNLEYIRQILSRAFTTCLQRSNKRLTIADLHDACATIELGLSLSKEENPFNLNISTCYGLIDGSQK